MQSKTILYQDDETVLEGYAAFGDRENKKRRPGILIAHDWSGRNEFACQKAEKIAQLGYIGFAIDMFGKGVLGETIEEKAALVEPFKKDRTLLLKRILSAYEALKKIDVVDTSRIGAIGFCFGGMCVLDLARSGADLKGAVSVHGILVPPPYQPQKINAKILALHGYEDPMVPPAQVAGFEQEMAQAGADWQLYTYGNTMHAFTNPKAHDRSLGTVYNSSADKRSWIAMQNFFTEIFFN